jgi:hypothetical protein
MSALGYLALMSRINRMQHRAPTVLLALLAASPAALAPTSIPPFVAKLIAHYKSGLSETSPRSIWRHIYKGEPVYYVPPSGVVTYPAFSTTLRDICSADPTVGLPGMGTVSVLTS